MATLRAAIDARGATRGAAEFNRAADSMKAKAERATKSIGLGFSSAMSRILMFGGAGGAIYTLKKFIDSASDAQETMNKFNVVFRENAKEAAAWAEEFGDKVGRATQDVEKWMAGLQDTFVPLGFARDKAEELSKSLTGLAVDVASFNNASDENVIRAFTSALVGNHEAVRSYQIMITQTALKQEALNQGITKSWEKMTEQEKVLLRLNLLFKGSKDAQGDAIRSSGDYANQVKRLHANFDELSVTLGNELLPHMTDLVSSMNDFLTSGDRAANAISRVTEAMATYWKWYSRFMKYTPGGKLLGYMYGGLAAPIEEKPALLPKAKLMGQMPETEEVTLSERLREVYPGPAAGEAATNAEAEFAEKRLNIVGRMYADMGRFDEGYRQSQVALLDQQKAEYGQYVSDKILLKKWYSGELNKLQDEVYTNNLDAMGLYYEELRINMEDTAKYTAEKFAEASRSIESSLSDAFYGMIAEGESFEESMERFFEDIGRAFARMVSDMIAEWVMYKALEPFDIGGGGNTAAAIAAAGSTAATAIGTAGTGMSSAISVAGSQVSIAITTAGAQAAAAISAAGAVGGAGGSAYGNVFDRGRLVPMANGAIFDSPTYFPLADGKTGLMGEAGPEGVMPLRRGRGGRLGVDAYGGTPNITVSPTPVKIVFVKNAKEAAIEALKSKEGERVVVSHAVRNRSQIG